VLTRASHPPRRRLSSRWLRVALAGLCRHHARWYQQGPRAARRSGAVWHRVVAHEGL